MGFWDDQPTSLVTGHFPECRVLCKPKRVGLAYPDSRVDWA